MMVEFIINSSSACLNINQNKNNIWLMRYWEFMFSSPMWIVTVCSTAHYDLSSSAIGQNYLTPIIFASRFQEKGREIMSAYHRRWLKMPAVKKVIYRSLTFPAWKSLTLTTIQTCLVQANCFYFPRVSYISLQTNLTLIQLKRKNALPKSGKGIYGSGQNTVSLRLPTLIK